MAGEIQTLATSGSTVYAQVFNRANGQIWNTSLAAFQAYATANIANYAITMTEQGVASGIFLGNFPAAAAGSYSVVVRTRAGGSPAETDTPIAAGPIEWTGSAVASLNGVTLADGSITAAKIATGALTSAKFSVSAITGVASGILEKIDQIWRRDFAKVTLNRSTGELKTYADNGSDVLTTQTTSTTGDTQTQGAAS
jgi:hypothetical protein